MISIFANDFGEFHEVLEGRGDWDEGSYWLSMIRDFCFAHEIECLFVAAPWLNQIEGPEMAGQLSRQDRQRTRGDRAGLS